MSDSSAIDEFFSIWAESSAEKRGEVLDRILDPDVRYSDPNSPETISGVSAINTMIGRFGEGVPGGSAWVTGRSEPKNGFARARVAFGKDGTAMMDGQYFYEFGDSGRLRLVVGFAGPDGA